MTARLPHDDIERRIFLIREQKVMIDRDLASLYHVPTYALNQAVKRNLERFPEGFMFRLTRAEAHELITNCDQFATLKHSRTPPLAFTEYGVAMLSSVLRSRRAVQVNIRIIQTFIRLRRWVVTHEELAKKLAVLKGRVDGHDRRIRAVFDALQELLGEADAERKPIGFQP